MRKSQVTVFIIVAIILLGVIIGFYLIQKNKEDKNKDFFSSIEMKAKINRITGSVKTCQDISADEAVIKIGMQGGYNKHPETYLDFGWTFIPYYFIEGETILPEKANIEKDLGNKFDNYFINCLTLIDTQDVSFKIVPASTLTQISSSSVRFNIASSYILEKEGNTINYDFKNQPLIKDYKLNEMYETAKYITDSHKNNPPLLCMDCLVDMAKEKELLVDFINLGDTSKLVVITNPNRTSEEFIYQFIEKYKGGETQSNKITIPNA